MQAPQRGQRKFRALAVLALAAGGLLLLPSSGVNAAGHNGLSGGLLESIHDLVDVLGQAARHGDRKEVRLLDNALEDMIRAYEHQQKQQHHHHKGGAIHKGMQMAGKDHHAFDASPTATDGAKSKAGKGKGNFGHGMGQVGRWHDDGRDDWRHHFSHGAHEAFRHGHEARDDDTSAKPPTTAKGTDSGTSNGTKTGVGSGMQTASSKTGTTTQTAGSTVGKKTSGSTTPTAITTKASGASKTSGAKASGVKTGSGIAAASSKTAGTHSTATGAAKPASKDHCAAEAKFHDHHVAANAKANVGKATPSAAAGNKQIANVGKLPSAGQNAVKKAATPTHVATNFAQSGRGVGASVGQHRPVAHAATTAGKKK